MLESISEHNFCRCLLTVLWKKRTCWSKTTSSWAYATPLCSQHALVALCNLCSSISQSSGRFYFFFWLNLKSSKFLESLILSPLLFQLIATWWENFAWQRWDCRQTAGKQWWPMIVLSKLLFIVIVNCCSYIPLLVGVANCCVLKQEVKIKGLLLLSVC